MKCVNCGDEGGVWSKRHGAAFCGTCFIYDGKKPITFRVWRDIFPDFEVLRIERDFGPPSDHVSLGIRRSGERRPTWLRLRRRG